jgi:hypothetical protein
MTTTSPNHHQRLLLEAPAIFSQFFQRSWFLTPTKTTHPLTCKKIMKERKLALQGCCMHWPMEAGTASQGHYIAITTATPKVFTNTRVTKPTSASTLSTTNNQKKRKNPTLESSAGSAPLTSLAPRPAPNPVPTSISMRWCHEGGMRGMCRWATTQLTITCRTLWPGHEHNIMQTL